MKPLLLMLLTLLAVGTVGLAEPPARFYKGNTHTHTLWSDGDAAPEMAADWYRSHGYDFLVLSDHNILSTGEKWFPIRDGDRSRLTGERVAELQRRFGEERVTTRERDGTREMRLKTLPELREWFEEEGEFLFIQGEEVTDRYDPKKEGARKFEVHINALNIDTLIPPQGGASVIDVMNRNVDAIIQQGETSGRPVLAHINHPNFGWSMTWRDVAAVSADRFFEVFNGHRGTHPGGDDKHDSMDQLWDKALTLRLTELDLGLLYGLATDDSHSYWGPDLTSIPGRGWVMVRAAELSENEIIRAMKRGDFYASTGVVVDDFSFDGRTLSVVPTPREGETLTVRFIGTRMGSDGVDQVGAVLMETTDRPASYTMKGDELYLRAAVTSDLAHPDPVAKGDLQQAWIQPVLGKR